MFNKIHSLKISLFTIIVIMSFQTSISAKVEELADENYAKQVMNGIPCGYAGKPEDCAGGALLLCSDEGRYINGIDFLIDGGMHL